jgi:cobalt-zinc-cadmium efflux system protein
MLIVAFIGLLANLYAVFLLHKDSKSSINVRAAYLHLIGDSLSSVVVIIGGLAMMFYQIYWIDPLITVLIGLYILKETWSILKESVSILMMDTPERLNLQNIKNEIEGINGIENIHHLHVWSLTDTQCYFEAHIDTSKDLRLSEINNLRSEIEVLLNNNYGIDHVTLQFEYHVKDNKKFINPEI